MDIEEPIERLKLYSENAGLCLNGGTTCIVNISDLDWLLTAYEKEKEKNKRLEKFIENGEYTWKQKYNETFEYFKEELEEEKEKNKELMWKPITEYDRKKYDWVLVKYFDGDYECVPEVAEKRNDGKWYTSERQIPFEVKYFFDMQQILEEE